MALVLALAFVPTDAYAASSKSVAKQGFTTTTKTIDKKATTVKKGTTKLTYKKGQGFIKFKAPSTKTYSFTFSNLKTTKFSSNAYVSAYVHSPYDSTYVTSKTMSTKGGKSDTLWLSVNGYKHTGKMIYRPIASRTGKVKLKKGEVIYFYMYNGSVKTTATLKIS